MKNLSNLMKLVVLLVIVVTTLTSYTFASVPYNPGDNVRFHTGSFESGMIKANDEEKLLFVEFYADWCTPCKWMDKTTFRDNDVIRLMNSKFVALKMDIETLEGADLKDQYSIRMLPTILIFNSSGKMIDRVEKTLSPESMVSLLAFHNNDDSLTAIPVDYNKNPSQTVSPEQQESNRIYSQYRQNEKSRTNYKLQVANFTDYTQAFIRVEELKDMFMEPIVVVNDYVNNMTQYRVLMGEFKTMEEAESYRKILERDFSIEAIIR